MKVYGYGVHGVLSKIREDDIFQQLRSIMNVYHSIEFIPDNVSIQSGFSSSLLIDLLILAESGDILAVDSLGRLAFSYKSFFDIVYFAEQKGVKLHVLDTPPALYATKLDSILSVENRTSRIVALDNITDAMVRDKYITDKLTALRNVAPTMLSISSRGDIRILT